MRVWNCKICGKHLLHTFLPMFKKCSKCGHYHWWDYEEDTLEVLSEREMEKRLEAWGFV